MLRPALVLLVGLLLLPLSASIAEDPPKEEPLGDGETFAILNPQGMKTRGTMQIGGVTTFNEATFTWYLEGIVTELTGIEDRRVLAQDEGMELTLENLQDGIWSWRFSIDLNLFDRCSCVLRVAQVDEQREVLGSDNLAVFIGEGGAPMTQIGWLFDDNPLMNSGSIYFEAAIFDDPEVNQSLHASIRPYASPESGVLGATLVSGISLDSVQLGESTSRFEFNHMTNISVDGLYRLSVYSPTATIPAEILGIDFYLDLTPPQANISCPDEIVEGTDELLVDGTHSTDLGSKGALTYSWIIEYPDGYLSAPDSEMLAQPDLLRFIPLESGQYNLTLRVVDLVGHVSETTHSVNVINQAPEASLIADGLSRSDGDLIITDSGAESMSFDASNSSDTSNDIDDLQYAWYLEGLLVSSESTLQLSIAELPPQSVLELIVKDDQSSNDTISVVLVNTHEGELLLEEIASTESSFYTGLNLVLATGLVCVLLLLIVKRSTLDEDKLPKWSKRKRR